MFPIFLFTLQIWQHYTHQWFAHWVCQTANKSATFLAQNSHCEIFRQYLATSTRYIFWIFLPMNLSRRTFCDLNFVYFSRMFYLSSIGEICATISMRIYQYTRKYIYKLISRMVKLILSLPNAK